MPFVWGLYEGDSETYLEFESTEELLKFLEDKNWTVYAHNGGRFDYHYLRHAMNADDPVMVINGRMAKFKIGECEFRDSANLMPAALAEIGNKREIDYALMEPDRRTDPNVRAEISKYLRADCVELWLALERYFSEFGQGLTQAGSAMKYWSRTSGIDIPRQTAQLHDRYRPYYYGGRVECFTSGYRKKDFKVIDINSAYPKAMTHAHIFSSEARINDHLPSDELIERCLIRLRCVSTGAFPFRTSEQKLIFPDDETVREYTITGWEFIAALEFNAIHDISIIEVHQFDEVMDFESYVMQFYEARKKAKSIGDKAGDLFAKIYMNALYGKFGASPSHLVEGAEERYHNYREYVIATTDSVQKWATEGYRHHIQPGYVGSDAWGERILMERPLPEEKEKFYNVATAASITGWVRAYMFRSLNQCGGRLYCDTDSIAAEDVSMLPLGSDLGQWKQEMQCDEYAICGKKLYAFHNAIGPYDDKKNPEWKIACKGVDFDAQQIKRIASGETILYVPDAPTYSISRATPRFIQRRVAMTA